MLSELSKPQLRLALSLLDMLPTEDTFEWQKGRLADGSDELYSIVWVKARSSANHHFVFNVPERSGLIFVTVTEGGPKDVGNVISTLEYLAHEEGRQFGANEVVLLSDEYLQSHGGIGVLLLPAYCLADDTDLSSTIEHDGQRYDVLVLAFVNDEDYSVYRDLGCAALLSRLDADGRHLAEMFSP